MVRFIIITKLCGLLEEFVIYIPIWLDLLYILATQERVKHINLHSNMVRFIILKK